MAAVVLDFENLQFLSCGLCRHAKISTKSDNQSISYGQKSEFQDGGRRHLEVQKFQFLVTWRDCNRVQYLIIWCSVQNFIKIGQFFTEIWRFNDFQNGGRRSSWILHICIFCPVALVLSACRSAFSYKISLKSDNRSMNNGQKSDF